jgi:hypothetical protein
MKFKEILIKNGALKESNYVYKGKMLIRKPIEELVAQSMIDYLNAYDLLALPVAEQQYADVLKENDFIMQKDKKNLPLFCFPSVNPKIDKMGIQYSTIKRGIDKYIQENFEKKLEFKIKLQRNYKTFKEDRPPRANLSLAFLDEGKFDKFIRENTQIIPIIKAIFNFPKEFALPGKSMNYHNNL